MNIKKKLLLRSLLGAPVGVVISTVITIIISLCTGHGEYYAAPHELVDWCGSEITAVIVQTICALAVGAIGGGSSVIWEIEKWNLTKQTLVHFAVISVSFVPISYVLNWLPHYLYGALGYVAAFLITYLVMWLSIYLSTKAKIKKMNKQLEKMRQSDEAASE